MSIRHNPYLAFGDEARQAMEFYRSVFGGTLEMNTFGEFGASDEPGEKDKIMHAQLETDAGLVLMASDTSGRMEHRSGSSITISLSGDDEAELRGYWAGLADGGTVTMPLDRAPWGDYFGMCTDRFGIAWMVDIAAADQQ